MDQFGRLWPGGHRAWLRAARHQPSNAALRVGHFILIALIIANTDLTVTIPGRAAVHLSELVPVKIPSVPVRIAIPSFDCVVCFRYCVPSDPPLAVKRTRLWKLFKGESGHAPLRHLALLTRSISYSGYIAFDMSRRVTYTFLRHTPQPRAMHVKPCGRVILEQEVAAVPRLEARQPPRLL